jgi:hypothetical protein
MKRILILAALLLTGLAKIQAQEAAFQAGEKLTYKVSYSVIFLQPDIATVTFSTIGSSVDNVPAYRVTAVAEVDSKWRWFFDMRDEYSTLLSRETLRPLYFSNNIKQGSYRFTSEYFYDWEKMTVDTYYKNLKYNVPYEKHMTLTDRSFDGVATFFDMRNKISRGTMNPGETGTVNVVMSDKIQSLQYKFLAREERDIEGMGRYRTLKFSCQLVNGADQDSFQDGSEFFIWFSDDRNCIPLYVESPIRVGSIKGRLVSTEGLKVPLGGKVR